MNNNYYFSYLFYLYLSIYFQYFSIGNNNPFSTKHSFLKSDYNLNTRCYKLIIYLYY